MHADGMNRCVARYENTADTELVCMNWSGRIDVTVIRLLN